MQVEINQLGRVSTVKLRKDSTSFHTPSITITFTDNNRVEHKFMVGTKDLLTAVEAIDKRQKLEK